MSKHLYVFRPGEEIRMLARYQFGVEKDGRCGHNVYLSNLRVPMAKDYQERHCQLNGSQPDMTTICGGHDFFEYSVLYQFTSS